VVEPNAIDYTYGDETTRENGSLRLLARDGGLSAFQHDGCCNPWIGCMIIMSLESLTDVQF
jgi:hypothetical protein